jgi:hypothetical protein
VREILHLEEVKVNLAQCEGEILHFQREPAGFAQFQDTDVNNDNQAVFLAICKNG